MDLAGPDKTRYDAFQAKGLKIEYHFGMSLCLHIEYIMIVPVCFERSGSIELGAQIEIFQSETGRISELGSM
jgi:hypothetical protein